MSDELEKKVKDLEVEMGEMAPAWVTTFGDLMSLLLCFFVLLLSFSEMDKAKYKEVAGSLAKAFGVQRKTKAFEAPKGLKMIAKDFDQEVVPVHVREEFVAFQERESFGDEVKKEVGKLLDEMEGMKDMIEVAKGKQEVTIRLMGETAFDSGKIKIRAEMTPLLAKIGEGLTKTSGDIIIAGHTDNVPLRPGARFKTNLDLSIARAAAVAHFLIHGSGISPQRVATMGFGEYRPLTENDTPEGRRKNRRVEIVLKGTPPPEGELPEGVLQQGGEGAGDTEGVISIPDDG